MSSKLHPVLAELEQYSLVQQEPSTTISELLALEARSPRLTEKAGTLPPGFVIRSINGSPIVIAQCTESTGKAALTYALSAISAGEIAEIKLYANCAEPYTAWISSALIQAN